MCPTVVPPFVLTAPFSGSIGSPQSAKIYIMMHNASLDTLYNLRTTRALISLCIGAYAQADLGLRCPLTESVDEQKMPRLDCTYAHAEMALRCPQIA